MENWTQKKRWLAIVAGTGTLLALIVVGLAIWYTQSNNELPQPILAFASDRSGAGDIFLIDESGEISNITAHPDAEWDPVWAPDGRRLAFTSHRSGDSDIWLLDLERIDNDNKGKMARNLTRHPSWDYSPTWSPSGQSIAFVSERDGDPEIFIQNLEEDSAIQLTFNEGMDRRPAWSPDGKHIAFAAVRNGSEEIYRVRPDGTDEQLLTPHSLQGTAPTWSPDSQRLAFVGWDKDNQAGIYVLGPTEEKLDRIYQGPSWIGSLNWSADGEWLTFTSWESGNHELYALPVAGGFPTRMTFNEAWDDFLAINPTVSFATASSQDIAQAAPAIKVPPQGNLATGVNLADLSLAYLINDMGFGWGKSFVNWATVEPKPGEFRWVDPDNIVEAFGDQEVKILMRIHGTPTWARPPETHLSHPPNDMTDFGNFMTALATRYKGRVHAYEIWNEPNLHYEWGNTTPDPAAYTEMLKTAYTAVKKEDPEALVIIGGLATTGQGSPTAYGDLDFLEAMYQNGAKGYFDALGSHPYAYGQSPHETHPDGLSFNRVEEQYQVMVANGDGETPIWITEAGWVLDTHWDLGEHQTIGVTQEQQAQYLAQALLIAEEEWPFVQAFFLFNLDFSTVSWYPAPEPMRWYAVLNPDRTPRPAYTSLRQMMRSQ